MSDTNPTQIHAAGEATGFIPAPGDKGKPITVIGANSIRAGFDATWLQQALKAHRGFVDHRLPARNLNRAKDSMRAARSASR